MERSLRNRLAHSLLLIASLLVSYVFLAFPIYVIRPFRHQGAHELVVALAVLRVRPLIEAICFVFALAGLPWYWRAEHRRSHRILVAAGALLVCAFAVLSGVNVYELMFRPVKHPAFVAAQQLKLDPEEEVIVVKLGGEARAYPIRSISYHHVVNDILGRVPIVATY